MKLETGDRDPRDMTNITADPGSAPVAGLPDNADGTADAAVKKTAVKKTDAVVDDDDGSRTEGLGTVDDPLIYDHAPHRIRDRADLLRLAGSAIIGVLVTLVSVYLTGLTTGMQSDMERYAQSISWLITVPFSFLSQLCTVVIIGWGVIQTLAGREWAQCLSAAIALILGYAVADTASWAITAIGNAQLISALVSPNNVSGALLPDLYAGIAAFLTANGPRRLRSSAHWGWIIIATLAAILVILDFESIAGTAVSLCLGRVLGLAVRYIVGSPSFGAWGRHVTDAMASIGLHPVSLVRRRTTGARNTADGLVPDSRIYDMQCDDGTRYVVSVCDEQRHTSGYLRQLWQMITLTGISHRTDRSARGAVRHHRTMLMSLRHMGLEQLDPYEVTYSRESAILVLNTTEELTACDWESVTDNDVADAMAYLRHANDRGYTNRLIHPGSFARTRAGNLVVTGWDIGDDGSNAANIAIDRVQMLAALMCTIGIDRAITCGIRAWGRSDMAALQPYVQSAVIPMETMRHPQWDRRRSIKTLRSRLGSLLDVDETEQPVPVTITRFSLRSILSMALLIIAVVAVFTQLNLEDMVSAVKGANPGMALACFLIGCLAWAGMSITLTAFMDRDKRNFFAAFMAQVTTGFTAVSMPAGVGPAFVNLQFLRKSGYRNSTATAIMSAVVAVQVVMTVLLIVFVGLFTGRNTLSSVIPTGTVAIVIGIAVLVVSLCMIIPPVRSLLRTKLMPLLRQYTHQLVALLSQPLNLAIAAFGAVLQSVALGVSFWAALLAFGYHTNVVETTFLYLLSNTIGSAVPTPGGLGGVEAMLFAAFTSTGVPGAIAMSATMLFRVLTYWIRIPLGALSMKWLEKHNLI